MNQRFTFHNQMQHRNLRTVGTGTPDTTKWQYGCNLRRDALSSHVSHFSRLLYFSTIQNQSMTRVKNRIIQEMIQPCGPPPPTKKKGQF